MAEFPKLSGGQIALGASVIGASALLGGAAIVRSRRKKTRKRRASSHSRSRKRIHRHRKLKFGSPAFRKKYLKHGRRRKQKKPYTAGKRRDTSSRRIRFTKRNQPYIILSNGRARFISKNNLSSSRKRSGGRY